MVWRALGLAAADEPLQPLANRLIVFHRQMDVHAARGCNAVVTEPPRYRVKRLARFNHQRCRRVPDLMHSQTIHADQRTIRPQRIPEPVRINRASCPVREHPTAPA